MILCVGRLDQGVTFIWKVHSICLLIVIVYVRVKESVYVCVFISYPIYMNLFLTMEISCSLLCIITEPWYRINKWLLPTF